MSVTDGWTEVTVADRPMPCYLSLPSGPGPFPGVIVCMHAPGVDAFIQGIVDRLAAAGMAAIAPDLYHRQPEGEQEVKVRMGRLRDEQLLIDLDAASAHLRGFPEVDEARTATIGFCMGGRIAYLHATADPRLRAAVVFYGGNILRAWVDGESPFERSRSIACPVLGLFGAQDKNPSPDDVARIDAELQRLGKPHEFHSYPGAGHAFLNDQRPSYRPEAAAEAWGRCLDWLKAYLG
jgi:carboxymethylenebutenolidase